MRGSESVLSMSVIGSFCMPMDISKEFIQLKCDLFSHSTNPSCFLASSQELYNCTGGYFFFSISYIEHDKC